MPDNLGPLGVGVGVGVDVGATVAVGIGVGVGEGAPTLVTTLNTSLVAKVSESIVPEVENGKRSAVDVTMQ